MKVVLLGAAFGVSVVGFAWLALAMETHWQQVRGGMAPSSKGRVALRVLGVLFLAISLGLCLWADHASMAALVWPMALASGAVTVAMLLAWRPRWLAPLAAWVTASQPLGPEPPPRAKASPRLTRAPGASSDA